MNKPFIEKSGLSGLKTRRGSGFISISKESAKKQELTSNTSKEDSLYSTRSSPIKPCQLLRPTFLAKNRKIHLHKTCGVMKLKTATAVLEPDEFGTRANALG